MVEEGVSQSRPGMTAQRDFFANYCTYSLVPYSIPEFNCLINRPAIWAMLFLVE